MNFFDKLIDKMYIKQWNIGLVKTDVKELIRGGNNNLDYKWLPATEYDRFFADPFIFKTKDGKLNVIYEDYSYKDQYGKISLTTLDENFKPVFQKLMLDTKSHLSYPNVFIEDGKTYIMPEASKSGHVSCYEYDFSTRSLVNKKDIIRDMPLVDSTILKYNNKYWLFATKRGNDADSSLYIYYADSFKGDYKPHAKNPVKQSQNGSRPAGNFFKVDDSIYRPSQNCADYYGKSITINRIKVLTEKEFSEEAVLEIESPKGSQFNFATHTINILDDVIVIDGLKRTFVPFNQVKTYLGKMFARKKSNKESSKLSALL